MNLNQKINCKLQHYKFCEFEPKSPFIKKKISFYPLDEDSYEEIFIEEYESVALLFNRISELNQNWIDRNTEKKEENLYFMINIKNYYGNLKEIGICGDLGWYIPDVFEYTLDYINKIQQEDADEDREQKCFSFLMPFCSECFQEEILSEEKSKMILSEWLKTGTYTQYFLDDSNILKTKKYIFKLNSQ